MNRCTSLDFIIKARKVHGDRYDYSKTAYVKAKTKVCIICPQHGEFWQTPNNHLNGKGCPICSGNIKSTTEEFIEKARRIHGSKYDYSKVQYSSAVNKVCIVCSKHGEFWQTPNNHLCGQGCPSCGGSMCLNNESFISRARKVHGDRYDYTKVQYKNNRTKVCVICPEHGEFWQEPSSHLYGCGCPQCGNRNKGEYQRSTFADFIQQARILYGDKYDYSKAHYTNRNEKIRIICPEHGEFWQSPWHHITGHQCPACSGVPRINSNDFISAAKRVHGDLYDYSQSIYVNAKTPVKILCREHGVFRQIPGVHLSGGGCPSCSSSHLETGIASLLENEGIIFEREKSFTWLRDQKPLKLDFYLPDFSVAIECQGIQHFQPIDFFGGDNSYEDNIHRDSLKRELCIQHGISILYFSNLGVKYPYPVLEDKEELIEAIKALKK